MVTRTPLPAPKLTETINTLTAYGDTDETQDLLTAAEWVTQTHTGAPHQLPDGTYGPCTTCHQPWPCEPWREIQALTLGWLVQASTTAVRRSQWNLRKLASHRHGR